MNEQHFIESLISDFSERIRSKAAVPVVHKAFSVPEIKPFPPVNPDVEIKSERKTRKELRKEILEELSAEIEQKRKDARARLAVSLKNARKRLRVVKAEIDKVEDAAKKAYALSIKGIRQENANHLLSAKARLKKLRETHERFSQDAYGKFSLKDAEPYPEIPNPAFTPDKDGSGIPSISGIYFFWDGDSIVYVGQSVDLSKRLRLGSHHALEAQYKISLIPVDKRLLSWAECYYIGITRARKNYGQNASHKKYAKEEI